jgi:hypothetical protein
VREREREREEEREIERERERGKVSLEKDMLAAGHGGSCLESLLLGICK